MILVLVSIGNCHLSDADDTIACHNECREERGEGEEVANSGYPNPDNRPDATIPSGFSDALSTLQNGTMNWSCGCDDSADHARRVSLPIAVCAK